MSELKRYEIYIDKDGKIQADKWVGDKWIKVGEVEVAIAERDKRIEELELCLATTKNCVNCVYSRNGMDASPCCDCQNLDKYEHEGTSLVATLTAKISSQANHIKELERQLAVGNEEGATCNRRCTGKMELQPPEGCSCHICAPCSACSSNKPVCSICGEESE